MSHDNWCDLCESNHPPTTPHRFPRCTLMLRQLHARDGHPSSRAVARRTDGRVSHHTAAVVLRGQWCRWSTVEAVGVALGATQAQVDELHDAWDEWNEIRRRARRQVRPLRIREGLVVRPGDTLVLSVEELNESEDRQRLQAQLSAMFPDNPVKLFIGAEIAVIRREEEEAA